jgi:hypothetical protein|tara:strand:- start:361 stop:582 length:222 start_codon:yes stop_codon:yes gene_type:complete
MRITKITSGSYKVEFNGRTTVIRQRYTSHTGVKKGWLLFNASDASETSDSNNWGIEAKTKRQALAWIKEEYSK